MATSKTCRQCGREVVMTRMSMLDYEDICWTCRGEEDKDGTLIRRNSMGKILEDQPLGIYLSNMPNGRVLLDDTIKVYWRRIDCLDGCQKRGNIPKRVHVHPKAHSYPESHHVN